MVVLCFRVRVCVCISYGKERVRDTERHGSHRLPFLVVYASPSCRIVTITSPLGLALLPHPSYLSSIFLFYYCTSLINAFLTHILIDSLPPSLSIFPLISHSIFETIYTTIINKIKINRMLKLLIRHVHGYQRYGMQLMHINVKD